MKLRHLSLPLLLIALVGSVAVLQRSPLAKKTSASSGISSPLPATGFTLDKVLGQPNFKETMINKIVADKAFHVGGVHVDNRNYIYVVDSGNNRILGFKNYTGDNKSADIVIGQPSAVESGTSNTDNTAYLPPTAFTLAIQPYPDTISTLESPRSLTLDTDANNNLYLVDLNNNRVLKYNDPFTTDNKADGVLGQPNLTTRQSRCGQPGFAPNASSLCTEWGTQSNGTNTQTFSAGVDIDQNNNIWVTDTGNNRVLRFPPGSKVANLVLGQPNFSSRLIRDVYDTSLNKLRKPIAVRVKPTTGEIYVLEGEEAGNNRILVFPANATSGSSATREIGRAFSQVEPPVDPTNWEVIAGRWVHVTTGLYWSRGFVFDPTATNDIWVNDGNNQRVLAFDANGNMSDLIGQPNYDSRGCLGTFGQGYIQLDGSKNSLCDNNGEIGVDSNKNLFVAKNYFPMDVSRYPLPLQRNPNFENLVQSNGWLLHTSSGIGWNQVSGSTFQNNHGISISKNSNPTQLFVSDGQRVSVWNNYNSVTTYKPADYTIGQDNPDENFNDAGIFAGQNVNYQTIGGNHLWVTTHDRVYAFALPITSSGKNYPPTKILYTGDAPEGNVYWDDDPETKVPFTPGGLVYDSSSESLWLSDPDRNRVIHIKNPLGRATVDLVLGQPDKNSTGDNASQGSTPNSKGFGNPWNLSFDQLGNLYVVDSGFEGWQNGTNNRVLRFSSDLINPVPGNIFPLPDASGVYAKPTFTTNPQILTPNRPNTPTHVNFDSQNRMYMTVDSYGNPQYERLFVYPATHTQEVAPQPESVIKIPFGQAAYVFVDPDDSHLILQDHTWNRILFTTLSSTPIATPTPPPVLSPTPIQSNNLLQNPSFELDQDGDNSPDSWSYISQFTRSPEAFISGIYAGLHYSTTSVSYSVFQTVNVVPNTNYHLSFWSMAPAPAPGNSSIVFSITWLDSSNRQISFVPLNTLPGAQPWSQTSRDDLLAPANAAKVKVTMSIRNIRNKIFVDDFDLHPTP